MKGRSITDAIATFKCCGSLIQTFKFRNGNRNRVHNLSVDLSKAFDSISRSKLLKILEQNEFDHDVIEMVKVLLHDTTLQISVNSTLGPEFQTNKGTPQGDGLSPILFIIYLAQVFNEVKKKFLVKYNIDLETKEIYFVIYADDIDILCMDGDILDKVKICIDKVFVKWDLILNESKTKRFTFMRTDKSNDKETNNNDWKIAEKLGSKLDDDAHLNDRLRKASTYIINDFNGFLMQNQLPRWKDRLFVYNRYILPQLTHGLELLALTENQRIKLDSKNRAHLRKHVLKAKWHAKDNFSIIKNEKKLLYEATRQQPLGLTIFERKIKTFRKLLLLDPNTPVKRVMVEYFETLENCKPGDQFRGKPKSNYLQSLRKDFKLIGIDLNTCLDMENLKNIVAVKSQWKDLYEKIIAKFKTLHYSYLEV